MTNKTKLLAIATTLAVGIGATNFDTADAGKHSKEKCYGVAKAKQNDCGSSDGAHACAGKAKVDSDPKEWIYLPKGICERLANGKLSGPEA